MERYYPEYKITTSARTQIVTAKRQAVFSTSVEFKTGESPKSDPSQSLWDKLVTKENIEGGVASLLEYLSEKDLQATKPQTSPSYALDYFCQDGCRFNTIGNWNIPEKKNVNSTIDLGQQ